MLSSARSGEVIRTPDQRLRVFVSSTLGEMAAERLAVRAAIERLHLIPVMFELGARPHPPAQLYRAYLDQSQVFIGLYWQRYGWTAPDEAISGLEDEFRRSQGMPRLMYLKEPAPEREDRLTEMLADLAEHPDASYRRFATPKELAALVEDDLAILLTERFEAGRAPASPTRGRARRLPAPLTPTIGRESEIDAIAASISGGSRLVTLTGPGGVGKTRVALDVARRVQDSVAEVRVVRLAAVVDADLVTAAIAASLEIPVERSESALDAVAAAVDDDDVLVVLDNMEQVAEAGPQLSELLERCAALRLLVTSRHVLRLRGEHEVPLAPLAVPEPVVEDATNAAGLEQVAAAPAVALFVEHARAARPDFELDAANVAAVVELCRRLDGLPLAIELVAARLRLLAPDALLDRLGDRLELLTSGRADLPERQRTLRATLDWSHHLLDPVEKVLFSRLAVFAGGAPLEAIERVCGDAAVGDVLETLSSLLEKSLVVTVDDTHSGPRIGMLQTVRSYAWEQLAASGDADRQRRRHASWLLDLAVSCDPARTPEATKRWPAVESEQGNFRAAAAWLAEEDDTRALSVLAWSLWPWYWRTGRMSEAVAWVNRLEPRRASLTAADDADTRARLAGALGAVAFLVGDYARAEDLVTASLADFEADGDEIGVAATSVLLAVIAPIAGDLGGAIAHAARASDICHAAGLEWPYAYSLSIRGFLTRSAGDREPGRAWQLEALEIFRRLGERALVGQALGQLALGALVDGDLAEARALLTESAGFLRDSGQAESAAYWLETAAALALAEGRPRDALVSMGAADAIRDRLQMAVWPSMRGHRQMLIDLLEAEVDPDEQEAARAEGRSADPFALLRVP